MDRYKDIKKKDTTPLFVTLPQTASPEGVRKRDEYNLYDDVERLRKFNIEKKD